MDLHLKRAGVVLARLILEQKRFLAMDGNMVKASTSRLMDAHGHGQVRSYTFSLRRMNRY